MTLSFYSYCLRLPCAGITGRHHELGFMQQRGVKPRAASVLSKHSISLPPAFLLVTSHVRSPPDQQHGDEQSILIRVWRADCSFRQPGDYSNSAGQIGFLLALPVHDCDQSLCLIIATPGGPVPKRTEQRALQNLVVVIQCLTKDRPLPLPSHRTKNNSSLFAVVIIAYHMHTPCSLL